MNYSNNIIHLFNSRTLYLGYANNDILDIQITYQYYP